MRVLIVVLMLLLPIAAQAGEWVGYPKVTDGDTLKFDGQRVRLLSLDAFEQKQECSSEGLAYPCGEIATRFLSDLIGSNPVVCSGEKLDNRARPLVHCMAGGYDLGREMVRAGWAIAFYGREYKAEQEFARSHQLGAWGGEFQTPSAFRHARK